MHEMMAVATDVPLAWCVSRSVWKIGCTDRGPVWGGESGGPKNTIRWVGVLIPEGEGDLGE